VTAKSVEEAVELALRELGATREEVEIDVLSRGRAGILGFGAEPARVRVTLRHPRSILEEEIKEEERPSRPLADAAMVDRAEEIVSDLLERMGVSAETRPGKEKLPAQDDPVIEVEGEDSALLIGRRGETLQAFQFLVNYLVHCQGGDGPRILIDVEGYKRRRSNALYQLAMRMAERVVATGRPVTLEPMSPAERRIIHVALAGHTQVMTQSTGGGASRQVSILRKRS